MRKAQPFVLLAVALLAQSLPHPARAALGGSPAVHDINTGARLKVAVRQSVATWKIQDSNSRGTQVHEYIAAATGKVFAVTWNGPMMPNLDQYLGDYISRYVAAAKRPAMRHRIVNVSDADLVIHSQGHQRKFVGQAWLPAQLPTGFTAADIK